MAHCFSGKGAIGELTKNPSQSLHDPDESGKQFCRNEGVKVWAHKTVQKQKASPWQGEPK